MHKEDDIVFLTSGKTPYRTAFFKELSKYKNVCVLYELERSYEREWDVEKNHTEALREIVLKSIKKNINTALCPEVLKYLKKDKKCVIVGGYSTPTGMLSIAWMKLIGKPYVLNADGGIIKKDKWLRKRIKKFFISGAAYWLSSGKKTTEYLEYYGADRTKIVEYPFASSVSCDILKNPIDKREKKNLRARLNMKEERIIISVGQFIPRKGFDILLKTEVLSDKRIGLYIIGGIPTEEYEKIKQDRGLDNVHFVGFKQKEELQAYYSAADMFVLPTREDIWGLVVNEAMAKGLPVITTDNCVAGMELVQNGLNGYIVQTENVSQLNEAIENCIFDDEKLERMSNQALKVISKYSIEMMVQKHLYLINDFMAENSSRERTE